MKNSRSKPSSNRPAQQRPRVFRVARAAVNRVRRPGPDFVSTVTGDLVSSMTRNLSRPAALVAIAVVAALIMVHKDNIEASAAGKWINTDPSPLATSLKEHKDKVLALLVFVPLIFTLPKRYVVAVASFVLAWVALVPQATFYEYVVQAIGLHFFFAVKRAETRAVLIGTAALAYFGGWVTAPSQRNGPVPSQPLSKTPLKA